MMDRVEAENNPVPLVLACVAYSMYKNEKRAWITEGTKNNGVKPTPEQLDFYVSSWSDLNIERTFAAAKQEIDNFIENIIAATTEDLKEEVFQALFRQIADQVDAHSNASVVRAQSLSSLIKTRTKNNWLTAALVDIVVSVTANFIWFALTIVIIMGLYAQFDLNRLADRAKNLFSPQEQSQPAPDKK
ncbi:hypothetical protein [Methylobacterium sp. ap11]|uniref:hypothetical protein n=1 Tax=Methylobacterium sp. ap11 TaxID=1761799 RepID=UPI001160D182|nr:hypothetical protein [Methylobacterium sp. ap11]